MLKTTTLKDLEGIWSVSYQLNKILNNKRNDEKVSLKEVMTENKERIILKDEKQYTRVKILWHNKGIEKRDVRYGKEVKEKKLKVIHENQFLISKIDAKNGAFGIVPKELDGAIISEEFKSFDIDINKIDLNFLNYFISTDYFFKKMKNIDIGHTFTRMNVKLFLDSKIVLPPLKEQKELISKLKELEFKEIKIKKEKELEFKEFQNIFFN
jgi:restriction endonuclease S subunit